MYLILDTETNGLPQTPGWNKYYSPKALKYYDNARVVQITAKLGDEILDMYIKPDGFDIENADIHGVTQDLANAKGIPFKEAGEKLNSMIQKSHMIVGHNIKFDIAVLLSEAHRHDMEDLYRRLLNKTFKDTMDIARFKFRKQMKLDVLYFHLFQQERIEEQKHNSLYDVLDTERCFKAMT